MCPFSAETAEPASRCLRLAGLYFIIPAVVAKYPSHCDGFWMKRAPEMESQRKFAYRRLLYDSLLAIRAESWALARVRWWNPRSWAQALTALRRCNALVDGFHNLASYSAQEFEGFREDLFWRYLTSLQHRHSEMNFGVFQAEFERLLAERPATQP